LNVKAEKFQTATLLKLFLCSLNPPALLSTTPKFYLPAFLENVKAVEELDMD